jgi:hypothetical protein
MSRAEVQRKVRVAAAVITQRPAQGAVPGPDGGVQVSPVVSAEPHRVRLAPVAPRQVAPGQVVQEALATCFTCLAAAALVPGQERSMWWRCGRKVPPLSRVTGHLRHEDDTTFALEQSGLPAGAAIPLAVSARAPARGFQDGNRSSRQIPLLRGLSLSVPQCGMAT